MCRHAYDFVGAKGALAGMVVPYNQAVDRYQSRYDAPPAAGLETGKFAHHGSDQDAFLVWSTNQYARILFSSRAAGSGQL